MRGNRLIGRYCVTGSLEAVSALSVSEGKDGAAADITCQRDGFGQLMISGTAIAGCLRGVVADPNWGGTEDDPAVSRITTYDSPLIGDTENVDILDGVTIDRITGAAAERMLYAREVVSPGARFAFRLGLDVPPADDDPQQAALNLVSRLVGALTTGITVGGSTTRGLGQVRLEDAQVTWTALASRNAFLEYLSEGAQAVTLPEVEMPRGKMVTITIPWQQQSPLLVSVPVTSSVHALPRHVRTKDGVKLTIPGASVKGILRQHAERIVRTLCGLPIPDKPLEQFQQEIPLVRELFGRAPDSKGEGAWRGSITCADVLSSKPVANWDALIAGLLDSKRESATEAANDIEKSAWLRVDDHVAISRWTGGSDDGKLFATLAPWPVKEAGQTWEPMKLTVDLARLGPDADACLMLLAYVLRDLCDGWLAFGHGTTRGYGEVAASSSDVVFSWQETGDELTLEELFGQEPSPLLMAWQSLTEEWRSRQLEETRS